MHSPKPTFSQQIITREVLSYTSQLTQLKIVQLSPKIKRQVFVNTRRRRPTQIRERNSPKRRNRTNILRRKLSRSRSSAQAKLPENRFILSGTTARGKGRPPRLLGALVAGGGCRGRRIHIRIR
uniref:Uncharacterized protein n=1 Tax=Cannabis sativa TaxID=3483 RepID=A0A803R9M2_CANSA